MTIDVYTATGTKKGTLDLPKELFEARVNNGLIHQAVVRQQSNVRNAIAHAKSRGEVQGSAKKLYDQKHTGRARRGSVRSPLLRGGGKAFGPKKVANFEKDMPKSMRHAAVCACLSLQAKKGGILGLENYPATIKTKDAHALLKKLPVQIGRRILFVLPERHDSLHLSIRNIPNVKAIDAAYLNPLDLISSTSIIFVNGAVEKAVKIFGKKERVRIAGKRMMDAPAAETPKAAPKAKKPAAKKTTKAASKKPSTSK